MQGLRRELGLAIPPRKPRRRRRGVSTGLPIKAKQPGHVWTWDFIHDIMVLGIMQKLIDRHESTPYTRSDNGSVQRSEAIYRKRIENLADRDENQNPLYRTRKSSAVPSVSDIFHGFIESFHARFRESA